MKDVFRRGEGDSRSIYSVDLLQSDKFLMSIQTIVHPSEAYHNLLTILWIGNSQAYLLVFLTNHVERAGLSSVRRWNICVKLEWCPFRHHIRYALSGEEADVRWQFH